LVTAKEGECQEPVEVCPFRPYLGYFQKINACNINYMAVIVILKMFRPEQKCLYSDKLLESALNRKTEGETGSRVLFTLHLKIAAMKIHDALGNRQTEAKTGERS